MGCIVGEEFIPPAGRRGRRPLQCQAGRFQIIINEQGRINLSRKDAIAAIAKKRAEAAQQ